MTAEKESGCKKSERIKVFRRFVSRSIKHAASFLSLFDISCGQLREMQKRRMSDHAGTRTDFPHMPTTHTRQVNRQADNAPAKLAISNHAMKDLEEHVRAETICRGCSEAKETGLVVCWPCFKYREDIVPLKYFDGTFTEWLKTISV